MVIHVLGRRPPAPLIIAAGPAGGAGTGAASGGAGSPGAAGAASAGAATTAAAKRAKKSSAILRAVASIRRAPSWASLPPTEAFTSYFRIVASPSASSSTRAPPLAKPAGPPLPSPEMR